jgi:hypothetical protein
LVAKSERRIRQLLLALAGYRNCSVCLDDLRWDRPDLDCDSQQARGTPRNLQLDETLIAKPAWNHLPQDIELLKISSYRAPAVSPSQNGPKVWTATNNRETAENMTIHTILDDAEPDDAAKAAQVMASAVAENESLPERIRHSAKMILSKTHDELVADITKARIIKAEAYEELTKLEGAE